MKKHSLSRTMAVLIALGAVLTPGPLPTQAAPTDAPVPISPAEGSTIVIPTFTWQASAGAAKYDVEVGPQSDPNIVSWSAQTVHLTLTPVDANKFPNSALYWRVRARDSSNAAGPWSPKINFTKILPAPALVSPPVASTSVITPTFEWEHVPEATYYQVELSTSNTFIVMEATYTTYNTRLTPVDTFAHGTHYWRVRSVDADGHVGAPSNSRPFEKDIPAPSLMSPLPGSTSVITPTFEWARVPEATYYQVELSASPTFVPLQHTYMTYNTRLTPVDTIAHGLIYWRVRSVDADGHLGTPSQSRSFTKIIPGPALILPNDGANLTRTTLVWTAVGGAAYYQVELSTSPTFLPIYVTYTTYNTLVTPVDAPVPGAYYWRVSGVDADGHVGAAGDPPRRFTLSNPPAGTDPIPQLIGPAHGVTLVADPLFEWTRVSTPGATYHLQVSTNPSFSVIYDSVTTDYDSYTPYSGGDRTAYVNGVYYWRVKASTGGQWSEARSFTKNEPLPLGGPDDGVTGLVVDPTFQWSQIVGAHHYVLQVSTNPSFSSTYDSVSTDYDSYTPSADGDRTAYVNGTYYWRVQAIKSAGGEITISEARSFAKNESLPLDGPDDGVTGLVVDPTFQWSPIVGAHHYVLQVSTNPSFSSTYDSVATDYAAYTPSADGDRAYVNGTYYWRVQAIKSAGGVITTSEARSFAKNEPLPLITPANGAALASTPTFAWNQIVGAHHYVLQVSTNPSFSSTYDSVTTDYPTYTPYTPGGARTAYANGTYYWRVRAIKSAGGVITSSEARSFTIETRHLYLPFVSR